MFGTQGNIWSRSIGSGSKTEYSIVRPETPDDPRLETSLPEHLRDICSESIYSLSFVGISVVSCYFFFNKETSVECYRDLLIVIVLIKNVNCEKRAMSNEPDKIAQLCAADLMNDFFLPKLIR